MIIKKEGNTVGLIRQIENILNTEKYRDLSTKQKICMLYLKYTMLCLDINEINLEYLNETSLTYGSYVKDQNLIYINPKEIKNKSSISALTTISHELRHCFQNKQMKPFKEFNVFKKSSYPIEVFDSYLNFILSVKKIDLYKYYYSSRLEKDARDYSIKSVKFLYNVMFLECKKGTFAHKWAKKELKRIQKLEKKEEKKYNKSYDHVEKTYRQLTHIVKHQILSLIKINSYNITEKKNSDLNNYIKKHFENYLYVYCDDEITNKIIEYCIQVDDVETLFMCLNHPYTRITEKQFKECVNYLQKNSFFHEQDIVSFLVNWKKEFLAEYFNKNDEMIDNSISLDNIFENCKKFVKKKNLKHFKNLQIKNTHTNNNINKNVNINKKQKYCEK